MEENNNSGCGTLVHPENPPRELTEEEKAWVREMQKQCLEDAAELGGYNYKPSLFEVVAEALIKYVAVVLLLLVVISIIAGGSA